MYSWTWPLFHKESPCQESPSLRRVPPNLLWSNMATAVFLFPHVLEEPDQAFQQEEESKSRPFKYDFLISDWMLQKWAPWLLRLGLKRQCGFHLVAHPQNLDTMLWGSPGHTENPHVDIPLTGQLWSWHIANSDCQTCRWASGLLGETQWGSCSCPCWAVMELMTRRIHEYN